VKLFTMLIDQWCTTPRATELIVTLDSIHRDTGLNAHSWHETYHMSDSYFLDLVVEVVGEFLIETKEDSNV